MTTNDQATGMNQELLTAAVHFNAKVFGIVSGIFAALALIVLTQISLALWGDNAGGYLGLLGVFLPGYTVTPAGTILGAIWAFFFAGFAGAFTYWVYGGMVGKDIASGVVPLGEASEPVLKPGTLKLYGVALGTALGLAFGMALFLSTAWLVLRGTADSSVHAALLGNYLPGYRVSFLGGLIGAAELFFVVFNCNILLAFIYNKVVDLRQGKGS
mgnify:CR=1 FL=1